MSDNSARMGALFLAATLGPLLIACAPSTSEPTTSSAAATTAMSKVEEAPPVIPAWVLDPVAFPVGRQGTNNCTFRFGVPVPQWDFHPDAGCWERPGPGGWTRQQQYKIHLPDFAACDGPADVSPIRVCKAPGLVSPCPPFGLTGPNGCALCVVSVKCHAATTG